MNNGTRERNEIMNNETRERNEIMNNETRERNEIMNNGAAPVPRESLKQTSFTSETLNCESLIKNFSSNGTNSDIMNNETRERNEIMNNGAAPVPRESLKQTSPTSGKGKRVPVCARCRNHGYVVRLKLHKRLCPYRDCRCADCFLNARSREISAAKIALRRRQKEDAARARSVPMPPVPVSAHVPPVPVPVHVSLPSAHVSAPLINNRARGASISERRPPSTSEVDWTATNVGSWTTLAPNSFLSTGFQTPTVQTWAHGIVTPETPDTVTHRNMYPSYVYFIDCTTPSYNIPPKLPLPRLPPKKTMPPNAQARNSVSRPQPVVVEASAQTREDYSPTSSNGTDASSELEDSIGSDRRLMIAEPQAQTNPGISGGDLSGDSSSSSPDGSGQNNIRSEDLPIFNEKQQTAPPSMSCTWPDVAPSVSSPLSTSTIAPVTPASSPHPIQIISSISGGENLLPTYYASNPTKPVGLLASSSASRSEGLSLVGAVSGDAPPSPDRSPAPHEVPEWTSTSFLQLLDSCSVPRSGGE